MAKNVTSLTLETLQTLDGTENVVMFDSAEGKRATLTTLSDYALKKHRSSGMDETIYDQGESLKQEITELKTAVGSPLVANTASEMTDQTKIYVYTGTETGYTAGHWYYYNGTEWADGGVYQAAAVATDKTLTQSDVAADAKAAGDALATKATPAQIDSKISANIDSTLSTTGKAADAKATGDSLAEKASSSGMVDMAKSLVGGKYTSDKQPYHFRKSPSGGAKDEVIVGGSLAWNQLCNGSSVTVQSGHKYIAKISGAFSIGASTGTAITGLTSGTDMVIDLTACFGSTIADYIYSLETANAGAGVAFVKRYIDLDTYHPYDAGSIQSVEGLVSHDVVGKNLLDYDDVCSWKFNNNFIFRNSGDKLSVLIADSTAEANETQFLSLQEGTYTLSVSNPVRIQVAWGKVKNVDIYNTKQVTFTLDKRQDDIHVKFIATSYPYDLGNVQLELGSTATPYEPYEKHSYPLDSDVVLRGVPKLVTDHIEFDGDKYYSDGTVERRYGVVDLGTLNWSYESDVFRLNSYIGAKNETNMYAIANIICPKYPTVSQATMGLQGTDIVIAGLNWSNGIRVCDSAYTDATSFKTAMSGIYLLYELATPTTETATPFQSPMIVGATEEYISDSVVPVGHESKYYEDVAKKVNGLPKDFSTLIAPTEVSFTATRNYSVGSYLIVKNQLYKVTSAISSDGTITPNSNVTATTIMAEILALA